MKCTLKTYFVRYFVLISTSFVFSPRRKTELKGEGRGEEEFRLARDSRLCPATLSILRNMVKGLGLRIAIALFIYNNIFCYSSSSSSVDARLRRDGVELYNALWGRLTPSCVPPQGVSLCVFPLSENQAAKCEV